MDWSILGAEFLGTFILIIFGVGVNASVSYSKMFANQPGKWIVVAIGWGLGVFLGVIAANAVGSTNHINPIVTIYATVAGLLPAVQFVPVILMQLLGAFSAALLLDFINWNHIKETDLETVRGSHCTGPAYSNFKEKGLIQNFSYELVGSLALLGMIFALGKSGNSWSNILGPIPVTLIVTAIGISLGSSTGYAINPARDLGPRLAFLVTEAFVAIKTKKVKIGANWGYAWVPVLAPTIAAVIIGLVARFA
ncbi:glycerol uptake facilitator protein [Mycoplasma testudineum]|uniref:Glycerol uptake facilitator protein n=1 Tax=Mycoplasma testudineum TaxID=244584 RepID=A0A4R6IB17_9MOLU|nr:MIP/aquaporin family protein [Mycoplasma testudineum]OYD26559.1 glycerol transporter [Mycoplasma testudineum]TDO19390.1 glycerol uptake facilitator protein [Mycoplasma testudineum]